jgi:hypothetical protein
VPRRGLLLHRLLRSQLGLLFTALVSAVVFPSGDWSARLRFAVGMWMILMTVRVYYTGVTLARTRLVSSARGSRRVAWIPIALATLGAAVVAASLAVEFRSNPPLGVEDLATRVGVVLASGAAGVVMWPFMALTRPLFASATAPFLKALAGAAAVLAATLAWVVRADEAMQDAAARAVERRIEREHARPERVASARATGLRLAASGRPEGVFFWKNGVQTMRAEGRVLVRYVVPLVAMVAAMASVAFAATHARGGAAAACFAAGGVAAFASLLGPQIVRTDLRSDLRHLEILKTWPVDPSAVVRGEMLWPMALLTGIAWVAIVCAALFSTVAFPEIGAATRIAYAAAAAAVAPALLAAQYLVQNAAAVFFPAWIPQGESRPRGVDAMGQRLILFGGVMLAVAFLVLPGAIAGGVVWLGLGGALGRAAVFPAAVACSAIVTVETLALTEALGPAYERLDILSVERSE